MTAVEFLEQELDKNFEIKGNSFLFDKILKQAKEMEKEQIGYSEEDVRLAYFQGEKDSYVKGGQTKKMEDEFIESLKQKKQEQCHQKKKHKS